MNVYARAIAEAMSAPTSIHRIKMVLMGSGMPKMIKAMNGAHLEEEGQVRF